MLDGLAQLNQQTLQEFGDPEIATRIAQYEMAYRMQASVPELTDFSREPAHILEMYGPDVRRQGSFAYNCLMARALGGARRAFRAGDARRLGPAPQSQPAVAHPVPRYRRTLRSAGEGPEAPRLARRHAGDLGRRVRDAHRSCRARIEETAVWGRDHHPYGFTIWLAGGGVKGGLTYGATDAFAHNALVNPVHVHDLQATILHLLGIDHRRLTFPFPGGAIFD